jgi:large subunit ribosomal protein L4
MIEVKAFDAEGKPAQPVQVSEELFGGTVKKELLREALIMYENNHREGNASVLRRGEIAGSTRKLWRQKHTGRARVGDSRSPIRRGGGSVFGPKPRDYRYAIPKKASRIALNAAILAKLIDDEVVVAECATPSAAKTKPVASYLKAIGVAKGANCLYVTPELDAVFYKSARNIDGLSVLPLADLNAYAVVRPTKVVFSRKAFEKLLEERR